MAFFSKLLKQRNTTTHAQKLILGRKLSLCIQYDDKVLITEYAQIQTANTYVPT